MLLRQEFQLFWEYESQAWAAKFLDAWCEGAKARRGEGAMRSRIDPVKKFAGTVRAHRELLLNDFRAKKQFSSGVIEGLNSQSHTEKSVRLSDVPHRRALPVSHARQACRAETRPQIPLTNHFSDLALKAEPPMMNSGRR